MIDHWVVVCSLIAAAIAAIVNVWAGVAGFRPYRTVRTAVGVVAIGYVGAYGWLLAHQARRLQWSHVMAGVGLVAWILVWIIPAIIAIRIVRPVKPTKVKD